MPIASICSIFYMLHWRHFDNKPLQSIHRKARSEVKMFDDMRAWHYFIALEKEVVATTEYVEPHPDNFAAFSDKYAGLILMIGSEVDVSAKLLCESIIPEAAPYTINDWRKIIMDRFVGIQDIEIEMPRYKMRFKPWESWGYIPSSNPTWWHSYNRIKHNRLRSQREASQDAVFHALCGLFSLNLYIYREIRFPDPFPSLLNFSFPEVLVSPLGHKDLPGILAT